MPNTEHLKAHGSLQRLQTTQLDTIKTGNKFHQKCFRLNSVYLKFI